MTEANTGVAYWLSEPVKNLHEWLELMNEYFEAVNRKLKK